MSHQDQDKVPHCMRRRMLPLGKLKEFDAGEGDGGAVLICSSGGTFYLAALGQVDCQNIVGDLADELRLYHELLKEALRRLRIPIGDGNEFNRFIGSFAHKVGVNPIDARDVLEPLFRELTDKMYQST